MKRILQAACLLCLVSLAAYAATISRLEVAGTQGSYMLTVSPLVLNGISFHHLDWGPVEAPDIYKDPNYRILRGNTRLAPTRVGDVVTLKIENGWLISSNADLAATITLQVNISTRKFTIKAVPKPGTTYYKTGTLAQDATIQITTSL